jgi:Fur family transcriptional regulator, ferric uptake regulator
MQAQEILHKRQLAKTPCRSEMLRVLLSTGIALTEDEIRDSLLVDFDRATIYRTLRTFLDMNIIHRVMVSPSEVKYAISDPGMELTGKPGHAHFRCETCTRVFCLGALPVDETRVPEGFEVKEVEIVLNGICDQCKE